MVPGKGGQPMPLASSQRAHLGGVARARISSVIFVRFRVSRVLTVVSSPLRRGRMLGKHCKSPPRGDYSPRCSGRGANPGMTPTVGSLCGQGFFLATARDNLAADRRAAESGSRAVSVLLVCRMPVRSVEQSTSSICPSGRACGLRRGVLAARQKSVRHDSSPARADGEPLRRRGCRHSWGPPWI